MTKRTSSAKWIESKGYWMIKVQKDGVRKSFYSTKPGRNGQRDANAKADKWLETGVQDGSVRCKQALEEFLELKQNIVGASQYSQLETLSRLYVLPVIGKKKMEKVTFDDLQSIIDRAVTLKYSAKYISNIRSCLSQFMRFCRRKNYTTLTTDDLDTSAAVRKGKKKILQPESIMSLFQANTMIYNGKRVYDNYINAYRFLVVTGLRPGELIGLKWEDIHGNIIYLQRAINKLGEVTKGKNENAIRPVPLTLISRKILDDQYNQTGKTTGYIFEVSQEATLSRRWKRFCESNSIPYCTLYELRHTFVSMVSSIPEGQLKQIVGHSKSMDTFDVYGHLVNGQLEDTAKKIDQIFLDVLHNKA